MKKRIDPHEVEMDCGFMKCIGVSEIFTIYRLSEDVSACFVCMPLFAERFVGPVEAFGKRGMAAVHVPWSHRIQGFFTEEEFQVVNGFKVLKKQVEWLAGRAAVKMLARDAGLCAMPSARICKEEGGAPYIGGFSHVPVSITHSGEFAVASLGRNGAVAVDIEKIEEGRMEKITRIAFTEREIDMVSEDRNNQYYLNWTMKEAYLKYLKKGFAEGLKNVEILNGDVFHNGKRVEGLRCFSEIIDGAYAFSAIY